VQAPVSIANNNNSLHYKTKDVATTVRSIKGMSFLLKKLKYVIDISETAVYFFIKKM